MDLAYSAEHEVYRDEVRSFLKKNKSKSPGLGVRDTMAANDWQQLLIEQGYAARTIPKEYGGAGLEADILKSHILAEELAQPDAMILWSKFLVAIEHPEATLLKASPEVQPRETLRRAAVAERDHRMPLE